MNANSRSKFLGWAFFICIAGFILGGCAPGDSPWRGVHVDIDYYIKNCRSDEILVKNTDGAQGIVGFFLKPNEMWHFGYHDTTLIDVNQDTLEEKDMKYFKINFDFYAIGNGDFQQEIGSYEFIPELGENTVFVDTCFVY